MRTDNNRLIALSRNRGDDAALAPRVRERLYRGAVVQSPRLVQCILYLAEQPGRRLHAILRFVVARVERGEGLEVRAHIYLRELLEQGNNVVVVCGFGGVCNALRCTFGAYFPKGGSVSYVKELDTIL